MEFDYINYDYVDGCHLFGFNITGYDLNYLHAIKIKVITREDGKFNYIISGTTPILANEEYTYRLFDYPKVDEFLYIDNNKDTLEQLIHYSLIVMMINDRIMSTDPLFSESFLRTRPHWEEIPDEKLIYDGHEVKLKMLTIRYVDKDENTIAKTSRIRHFMLKTDKIPFVVVGDIYNNIVDGILEVVRYKVIK